jgi:hypothetical protein
LQLILKPSHDYEHVLLGAEPQRLDQRGEVLLEALFEEAGWDFYLEFALEILLVVGVF